MVSEATQLSMKLHIQAGLSYLEGISFFLILQLLKRLPGQNNDNFENALYVEIHVQH